MYADRLLTYSELADHLGRSEEAARQLAKRRRWRRSISNEDGKARVAVPVEFLDAPRPPVEPRPDGETADRSDGERPEDDREDALTVVALLQEQVARLEVELAGTRTALDVERLRAAQVEVLQSLLEVERARLVEAREGEERRVADLKAERDRWAAQADRLIPLAENRSWPPAWWPFARRA